MTAPDFGDAGDLERSASDAIDRIQQIIETAERVAGQIRAGATEDAKRHVEDARRGADRLTMERVTLISQLTDSLIERADEVKRRSEELIGALEAAVGEVAPRSEPAAEPEIAPELAVLRATQMAVAGSERAEIEQVLRSEYGIRDTGRFLDRILGEAGA